VKYLQIVVGALATKFLEIKCMHSKNIPFGMFLTKRNSPRVAHRKCLAKTKHTTTPKWVELE
jgi:hypothetical protein